MVSFSFVSESASGIGSSKATADPTFSCGCYLFIIKHKFNCLMLRERKRVCELGCGRQLMI